MIKKGIILALILVGSTSVVFAEPNLSTLKLDKVVLNSRTQITGFSTSLDQQAPIQIGDFGPLNAYNTPIQHKGVSVAVDSPYNGAKDLFNILVLKKPIEDVFGTSRSAALGIKRLNIFNTACSYVLGFNPQHRLLHPKLLSSLQSWVQSIDSQNPALTLYRHLITSRLGLQ